MSRAQREQEAIDRQAVEAAGARYRAHRESHRCGEPGCDEGRGLAAEVNRLQLQHGTARFLALPEDEGTTWTRRS